MKKLCPHLHLLRLHRCHLGQWKLLLLWNNKSLLGQPMLLGLLKLLLNQVVIPSGRR